MELYEILHECFFIRYGTNNLIRNLYKKRCISIPCITMSTIILCKCNNYIVLSLSLSNLCLFFLRRSARSSCSTSASRKSCTSRSARTPCLTACVTVSRPWRSGVTRRCCKSSTPWKKAPPPSPSLRSRSLQVSLTSWLGM